ncbi:LOW QUALITY PROTEIN: target of Nesh-SH3-like [Gadus macrocephalus]|uniref:LOW QUALITY PROTEIN: target of Nesh-SH3-like n=1 Tax=Gadus macrocephalus TaxID=80720 RepID=UPI0028CBAEF8|nr:LOW QUALITY PROTEIN: target of Nesh-SH3-like [Gadus macrocephalus]
MGTVLCILLLLCGLLLVDSIPGEREASCWGTAVSPAPPPSSRCPPTAPPTSWRPRQSQSTCWPSDLSLASLWRNTAQAWRPWTPPLVAGSLSPTAVFLSWGPEPHGEGEVMEECLEEGFYTVRYRRRGGPWAHQSSPTAAAVLAGLRPASRYEFRVRASRGQRHGPWSAPLLHSTGPGDQSQRKAVQMGSPPASPLKPLGPRAMFPPRPALYNRTRPPLSSLIKHQTFPGSPRTSFANRDPLRPLVLPRPVVWSRPRQGKKHPPPLQGKHHPPPLHGYPVRPAIPVDQIPNLVGELGDKDQLSHWKQTERLSGVKPNLPAVTPRPKGQEERQMTRTTPTTNPTPTTTTNPTTTTSSMASRLDLWEESEVFSSQPNSDLDALGKKRFVAPHVVYKTDKRPEEPCSVTSSLLFFPGEKPGESDASTPPQAPPSNLTVVTVEGCPSFIILDWKNTDNHTQEYEVISTATGPDGEEVSVLTTDQTHTVVENLRPESSYAFKVKPKNDLGAGPPSEPVAFSTESADPRVSENASGKDAIWTRFPFRSDPPSDCTGQQYVKRTWYRKFVGVQLCNSLRYKIYLSDSLTGQFYDIGDEAGFGEDHCQFVDSFLDGRTGPQLRPRQLPPRTGFYRAARQEPVRLGPLGAGAAAGYVSWYECGTPIPGRCRPAPETGSEGFCHFLSPSRDPVL